MPITPDEVAHVAKLARLALDEAERDAMARQLGRILEYVEQLRGLDVSDVPPLTHPLADLVNVFRDDEPRPGLEREAALANAPDRDGPFFRVPAVMEDGGEEGGR